MTKLTFDAFKIWIKMFFSQLAVIEFVRVLFFSYFYFCKLLTFVKELRVSNSLSVTTLLMQQAVGRVGGVGFNSYNDGVLTDRKNY